MSKSTKKRLPASSAIPAPAAKASQQAPSVSKTNKKPDAGSKQSRVIAMLRSPTGATIAAIMKATSWQQHSVRGFLAGVVSGRLKLKLASQKVGGNRVYRIAGDEGGKSAPRQTQRSSS